MRTAWAQQAARINALSWRERLFLFISLISICLALVDMVWLTPAQAMHKQAFQKLEKQNADLKKSRDVMKALGDAGGGAKSLSAQMASVQNQLEQVNQSIASSTAGPVDDKPLTQVLVHLLRRYDGLSLVSTASTTPEMSDKKISADGSGAATFGLTRQGLELTVSGPYLQLVHYVQTLEAAMPYVRWGTMTLKSEKQPPELVLQMFLVGVTP